MWQVWMWELATPIALVACALVAFFLAVQAGGEHDKAIAMDPPDANPLRQTAYSRGRQWLRSFGLGLLVIAAFSTMRAPARVHPHVAGERWWCPTPPAPIDVLLDRMRSYGVEAIGTSRLAGGNGSRAVIMQCATGFQPRTAVEGTRAAAMCERVGLHGGEAAGQP